MTERKRKPKKKRLKLKLSILIVALIACVYLESSTLSIKRLNVQNVTITDSKIPESFNNAEILIFSDVFSDETQLKKVASKVKSSKPDFIVFLGNLLTEENQHQDLIEQYLKEMDAPLGKYAVLAQSDYDKNLDLTKTILSESEFRYYANDSIKVFNKTHDFITFNFLDSHSALESTVDKVNRSIDPTLFNLGFVHDPKVSDTLVSGYDTVFAGHTLLGKINLPLLGSISYKDTYTEKLQDVKGINLRLTGGVSTSSPQYRFLSSPDVIIVTLKSS